MVCNFCGWRSHRGWRDGELLNFLLVLDLDPLCQLVDATRVLLGSRRRNQPTAKLAPKVTRRAVVPTARAPDPRRGSGVTVVKGRGLMGCSRGGEPVDYCRTPCLAKVAAAGFAGFSALGGSEAAFAVILAT